MARVTVDDCLDHVENRFDLVLKASRRARQLANYGAEAGVAWDNDKPIVIALREIAQGKTDLYDKERARIRGLSEVDTILGSEETH